jgi:hypothetical protein
MRGALLAVLFSPFGGVMVEIVPIQGELALDTAVE